MSLCFRVKINRISCQWHFVHNLTNDLCMSIDVNRFIYFALRIKSDYLSRGIDVTNSRKQQHLSKR